MPVPDDQPALRHRDVDREIAVVGVELAAAQIRRLVLPEHVVEHGDLRVPLGKLENLVIQVAHAEAAAAGDDERPVHFELHDAARREGLRQHDPGDRCAHPVAGLLGSALLLTEGLARRKLLEVHAAGRDPAQRHAAGDRGAPAAWRAFRKHVLVQVKNDDRPLVRRVVPNRDCLELAVTRAVSGSIFTSMS